MLWAQGDSDWWPFSLKWGQFSSDHQASKRPGMYGSVCAWGAERGARPVGKGNGNIRRRSSPLSPELTLSEGMSGLGAPPSPYPTAQPDPRRPPPSFPEAQAESAWGRGRSEAAWGPGRPFSHTHTLCRQLPPQSASLSLHGPNGGIRGGNSGASDGPPAGPGGSPLPHRAPRPGCPFLGPE